MIRRIIVTLILAFSLFASASAQVVNPPYGPGNPVPAGSGGLGPYALPTPAASTTDFFEGDSLMLGPGATSCVTGANYSVVKAPGTLTGTCFTDLLGAHDAANGYDWGVAGTCLVFTTTPGSLCNLSSSTSGSLINRYANDFTHLTAGMRLYIEIGTNDAFAWSTNDPLVQPATFRANLLTVINAAIAKVGVNNIILGEIPYNALSLQGYQNALNLEVDDVARQTGVRIASNYESIQLCSFANPSDTNLCYGTADRVHPDNNGNTFMYQGFIAANYSNAVGGFEANGKSIASNFRLDGSNNVNFGGFSTLYLIQNTATNNTCGGYSSCAAMTVGTNNVGTGAFVLNADAGTSNYNTAAGSNALLTLTGSSGTTAMGYLAGSGSACNNFNQFFGYNTQLKTNCDSGETVIGGSGGCTGNGSNTATICAASGFWPTGGISDTTTTHGGKLACRHALATGTYTWTFGTAWTNTPACTATEESVVAAHLVGITAISASAVTVTSLTTSGNTDEVDIICAGQNG